MQATQEPPAKLALLKGELARAWVAEGRRIVKGDTAENKSC